MNFLKIDFFLHGFLVCHFKGLSKIGPVLKEQGPALGGSGGFWVLVQGMDDLEVPLQKLGLGKKRSS